LGGSTIKRAKQMKQEPFINNSFIYLYARNKQRYRYNLALQTFETCYPTKRTFINAICCKQWGQWQVIDYYLDYQMIEALKVELLTKLDY